MTTTPRHSNALSEYVQFGTTRLPGDCGIIALAVIVGKKLNSRGNYDACAEHLTTLGAYDENGTMIGKFFDTIRELTHSNSRKTRQFRGTTPVSYLATRRNWTGVMVAKSHGVHHGMAVVDGVIYNANDEWLNGDLIMTLAVEA